MPVLQDVEETVGQNPEIMPFSIAIGRTFLSINALSLIVVMGLALFCLTFQSDTVEPALPMNFCFDAETNTIIGPYGYIFPTVNQAWASGKPDWFESDELLWGEGAFPSTLDSLKYHFDLHGDEVGAINPMDYYKKAQNFTKNLKGAKKVPSRNSMGELNATRYIKNGRYVIIDNETHTILSYGSEAHND